MSSNYDRAFKVHTEAQDAERRGDYGMAAHLYALAATFAVSQTASAVLLDKADQARQQFNLRRGSTKEPGRRAFRRDATTTGDGGNSVAGVEVTATPRVESSSPRRA